MGITTASALFRGDPPTVDDIVAEIESASELTLVVDARPPGSMFRFHARLAFACAPREHVEVYAYMPGVPSTRDMILGTPGIDQLARDNPQVARMIEMYTKAPLPDSDAACVHTLGYIGEEGTLHDFTAIALESLGGALTRPISAERRGRCATKLTPALLAARHREHRRAWIAELLKSPAKQLAAAWRRWRSR